MARIDTWKEIKEAFERAGVKDEDEILYIDVTGDWKFADFVFVKSVESWAISS